MIGALDVDYRSASSAVVAMAISSDWLVDDGTQASLLVDDMEVPAYEPGAFYKKELPYLMRLLGTVDLSSYDAILVDGYVWLVVDRPGLGRRLFDALQGRVPIIGVAKTRFMSADAVTQQVLRGSSKSPLYVSAAGIDLPTAAQLVQGMHGPHRLPSLLSRANSLSRTLHR